MRQLVCLFRGHAWTSNVAWGCGLLRFCRRCGVIR